MGGPQLGVNSSPEGLHGRALASYPGPRELGLEARLVLLDGGAQAVGGGQGDAFLSQQQVVREEDGEGGCELRGSACRLGPRRIHFLTFRSFCSSCELSTTSFRTALHLLDSKARA